MSEDDPSDLASSSNFVTSSQVQYGKERIERLLKTEKEKYVVIKNETVRDGTNCWKVFGFPAMKTESDGPLTKIEGFASCRKCFNTYAYTPKTGNTRINGHKCVQDLKNSTNVTKSSSNTAQRSIAQYATPKSIKLCENEAKTIKDLTAKWLCHDIRPFSISEDRGLRELIQQCILLGSRHGNIDVNDVLRGAHVNSIHIKSLADNYRSKMKEQLKEPYENNCITISPDMWSDKHRKVFYLGAVATYVDTDHQHHAVDLFCRPYLESDKTADNILIEAAKENLITENKQPPSATTTASSSSNNRYSYDLDSSSDSEWSDDDDKLTLDQYISSSNARNVQKDKDVSKVLYEDVPYLAKQALNTITTCKKLVKYVKINGLNKDIQEAGGVCLQQSTVVRWLSLIQLLESILKSYKQTRKILLGRKQHLFNVDTKNVRDLARLLRPFKRVIKLIQMGNEPSLYMVLICVLKLRKILASFNNLLEYINEEQENEKIRKRENDERELAVSDEEAVDNFESEDMKFFRRRLYQLLNSMFILDIRHYAATLLNPRFKQLRKCSKGERLNCHKFIREEMAIIIENGKKEDEEAQQSSNNLKRKKMKRFGREFENDASSSEEEDKANKSDNESFDKIPQPDELDVYLKLTVDSDILPENPLKFWHENCATFPVLSKVARKIHSIPATTAAVERTFSAAGLVVTERRCNVNPSQADNILLIRSVEMMNSRTLEK
ncbi:unnamed protein product [Didymodactylos carnosus]|uniref:HAT C-terminal dimerisation domain-containing protein n=1 Tax=Didymodactylos carnosus TaxID=1234261 RepID=A0A815NRI3_9BILA|nr:unnamed protein product [Didymodactylos carnosus]CAF4315162.1 unnamed protein product [Didymodactylos carnosus]